MLLYRIKFTWYCYIYIYIYIYIYSSWFISIWTYDDDCVRDSETTYWSRRTGKRYQFKQVHTCMYMVLYVISKRDTFVNNFDRTLPLQLVTIPTFCTSSQVAIIKKASTKFYWLCVPISKWRVIKCKCLVIIILQ